MGADCDSYGAGCKCMQSVGRETKRKEPLGKSWHRWDIINVNLKTNRMGWYGLHYLTPDRDKW